MLAIISRNSLKCTLFWLQKFEKQAKITQKEQKRAELELNDFQHFTIVQQETVSRVFFTFCK